MLFSPSTQHLHRCRWRAMKMRPRMLRVRPTRRGRPVVGCSEPRPRWPTFTWLRSPTMSCPKTGPRGSFSRTWCLMIKRWGHLEGQTRDILLCSFTFLCLVVEVRPAGPARLQPRCAEEVEEWGEAAEEGQMSQPGRRCFILNSKGP